MTIDRDEFVERIARAYRVPYWIVTDKPCPSWLRRPIWRLLAIYWRYV